MESLDIWPLPFVQGTGSRDEDIALIFNDSGAMFAFQPRKPNNPLASSLIPPSFKTFVGELDEVTNVVFRGD